MRSVLSGRWGFNAPATIKSSTLHKVTTMSLDNQRYERLNAARESTHQAALSRGAESWHMQQFQRSHLQSMLRPNQVAARQELKSEHTLKATGAWDTTTSTDVELAQVVTAQSLATQSTSTASSNDERMQNTQTTPAVTTPKIKAAQGELARANEYLASLTQKQQLLQQRMQKLWEMTQEQEVLYDTLLARMPSDIRTTAAATATTTLTSLTEGMSPPPQASPPLPPPTSSLPPERWDPYKTSYSSSAACQGYSSLGWLQSPPPPPSPVLPTDMSSTAPPGRPPPLPTYSIASRFPGYALSQSSTTQLSQSTVMELEPVLFSFSDELDATLHMSGGGNETVETSQRALDHHSGNNVSCTENQTAAGSDMVSNSNGCTTTGSTNSAAGAADTPGARDSDMLPAFLCRNRLEAVSSISFPAQQELPPVTFSFFSSAYDRKGANASVYSVSADQLDMLPQGTSTSDVYGERDVLMERGAIAESDVAAERDVVMKKDVTAERDVVIEIDVTVGTALTDRPTLQAETTARAGQSAPTLLSSAASGGGAWAPSQCVVELDAITFCFLPDGSVTITPAPNDEVCREDAAACSEEVDDYNIGLVPDTTETSPVAEAAGWTDLDLNVQDGLLNQVSSSTYARKVFQAFEEESERSLWYLLPGGADHDQLPTSPTPSSHILDPLHTAVEVAESVLCNPTSSDTNTAPTPAPSSDPRTTAMDSLLTASSLGSATAMLTGLLLLNAPNISTLDLTSGQSAGRDQTEFLIGMRPSDAQEPGAQLELRQVQQLMSDVAEEVAAEKLNEVSGVTADVSGVTVPGVDSRVDDLNVLDVLRIDDVLAVSRTDEDVVVVDGVKSVVESFVGLEVVEEDTVTFDQLTDTVTFDQVKDAVMSDLVEDTVKFDEVKDAMMFDQFRAETGSEQSMLVDMPTPYDAADVDSHVHNAVQSMLDVSEETGMSNMDVKGLDVDGVDGVHETNMNDTVNGAVNEKEDVWITADMAFEDPSAAMSVNEDVNKDFSAQNAPFSSFSAAQALQEFGLQSWSELDDDIVDDNETGIEDNWMDAFDIDGANPFASRVAVAEGDGSNDWISAFDINGTNPFQAKLPTSDMDALLSTSSLEEDIAYGEQLGSQAASFSDVNKSVGQVADAAISLPMVPELMSLQQSAVLKGTADTLPAFNALLQNLLPPMTSQSGSQYMLPTSPDTVNVLPDGAAASPLSPGAESAGDMKAAARTAVPLYNSTADMNSAVDDGALTDAGVFSNNAVGVSPAVQTGVSPAVQTVVSPVGAAAGEVGEDLNGLVEGAREEQNMGAVGGLNPAGTLLGAWLNDLVSSAMVRDPDFVFSPSLADEDLIAEKFMGTYGAGADVDTPVIDLDPFAVVDDGAKEVDIYFGDADQVLAPASEWDVLAELAQLAESATPDASMPGPASWQLATVVLELHHGAEVKAYVEGVEAGEKLLQSKSPVGLSRPPADAQFSPIQIAIDSVLSSSEETVTSFALELSPSEVDPTERNPSELDMEVGKSSTSLGQYVEGSTTQPVMEEEMVTVTSAAELGSMEESEVKATGRGWDLNSLPVLDMDVFRTAVVNSREQLQLQWTAAEASVRDQVSGLVGSVDAQVQASQESLREAQEEVIVQLNAAQETAGVQIRDVQDKLMTAQLDMADRLESAVQRVQSELENARGEADSKVAAVKQNAAAVLEQVRETVASTKIEVREKVTSSTERLGSEFLSLRTQIGAEFEGLKEKAEDLREIAGDLREKAEGLTEQAQTQILDGSKSMSEVVGAVQANVLSAVASLSEKCDDAASNMAVQLKDVQSNLAAVQDQSGVYFTEQKSRVSSLLKEVREGARNGVVSAAAEIRAKLQNAQQQVASARLLARDRYDSSKDELEVQLNDLQERIDRLQAQIGAELQDARGQVVDTKVEVAEQLAGARDELHSHLKDVGTVVEQSVREGVAAAQGLAAVQLNDTKVQVTAGVNSVRTRFRTLLEYWLVHQFQTNNWTVLNQIKSNVADTTPVEPISECGADAQHTPAASQSDIEGEPVDVQPMSVSPDTAPSLFAANSDRDSVVPVSVDVDTVGAVEASERELMAEWETVQERYVAGQDACVGAGAGVPGAAESADEVDVSALTDTQLAQLEAVLESTACFAAFYQQLKTQQQESANRKDPLGLLTYVPRE